MSQRFNQMAALLHELASDHAAADTPIQVHLPSQPLGSMAVPEWSLLRALGNLLGNAVRHAPGSVVELVGERTADGLRLDVLDRGQGIPQEQIEAMFQPFQRLDASRQAQPGAGGVGLGLAIVRQLALVHGWQVGLERRVGGGLVAWVQLPPGTVEEEAGDVRT